jgi:amino-acid N-acetyltransferase
MTTIRPAQPGDFDAIKGLLADAALPTADLHDDLLKNFLVADDGSALVGCVGVERCGGDGLLRSLAVEDSRRGTGQGRHLVAAAEAQAARQGLGTLYLLTNGTADFFEARGYSNVERADAPPAVMATSQFSQLCPSSAHLMAKPLQDPTKS